MLTMKTLCRYILNTPYVYTAYKHINVFIVLKYIIYNNKYYLLYKIFYCKQNNNNR